MAAGIVHHDHANSEIPIKSTANNTIVIIRAQKIAKKAICIPLYASIQQLLMDYKFKT